MGINILPKKNKVTLTANERLVKESSNVYDIFNDAVSRLASVNSRIQAERDAQKEDLEVLILLEKELATQQEANTKLMTKIDSFLND